MVTVRHTLCMRESTELATFCNGMDAMWVSECEGGLPTVQVAWIMSPRSPGLGRFVGSKNKSLVIPAAYHRQSDFYWFSTQ